MTDLGLNTLETNNLVANETNIVVPMVGGERRTTDITGSGSNTHALQGSLVPGNLVRAAVQNQVEMLFRWSGAKQLRGKSAKEVGKHLSTMRSKFGEFTVDVPRPRKGDAEGNLKLLLEFQDGTYPASAEPVSGKGDGAETESCPDKSALKKPIDSEEVTVDDVTVEAGPNVSNRVEIESPIAEIREGGNKASKFTVTKPIKKEWEHQKKAKLSKAGFPPTTELSVVKRVINEELEIQRAQRDAG